MLRVGSVTDPRVAPVEDNLLAQARRIAAVSGYTVGTDPDVATYWSDLPFPLFNLVSTARFEPGRAARRTAEVIAPYLERGLPFLWWVTPSTVPDESVLAEHGLLCERVPGMYVDLPGPVPVPTVEGLRIDAVPSTEVAAAMTVIGEAFEMPAWVSAEIGRMLQQTDPAEVSLVLARLDGEPVGGGMLFRTGTTAGLYNIGTLAAARGRGVGGAVTAHLMELGRRAGCTHAILHASESGRPVYERLGFEIVCDVPQFVWLPPEA